MRNYKNTISLSLLLLLLSLGCSRDWNNPLDPNNTIEYDYPEVLATVSTDSISDITSISANAYFTTQTYEEIFGEEAIATMDSILDSPTSEELSEEEVLSLLNSFLDVNLGLIEVGICWNTVGTPDLGDEYKVGAMYTNSNILLEELESGTDYYIRAFATNGYGTSYGNELQFTTTEDVTGQAGSFVDERDDNVYNYIGIGSYIYMAENLRYLPSVSPPSTPSTTYDCTLSYFYVYDYDGTSVSEAKATSNYSDYGVLYTWAAAQDVCPDGWHLPSKAEYQDLMNYLEVQGYDMYSAGSALKATSGWSDDGNGDDVFGFNALAAGYRNTIQSTAVFDGLGEQTAFWSKYTGSPGSGGQVLLKSDVDIAYSSTVSDCMSAYSVRCVKDYVEVGTTLPSVSTVEVADVTENEAIGVGRVLSDGGATVSERGVCWSTSTTPTIADNLIGNGTGTGDFTCEITGLSSGTTYYVRAYAINSVGTAYGNELQFTTSVTFSAVSLATLTTTDVFSITATTASSGGSISSDGDATVTDRGVCWSTSSEPTLADNFTSDGSGSGDFSSSLTGLSSGTTYYVRAYATNSVGTAYGDEVEFTTSNEITYGGGVNDYDGNNYETVIIGAQEWMAENLKVTHYPNGTEIPLVSDNTAWMALEPNDTDDAYCYYDNNSNSEYGAIYTYAAALNVCPSGWHLPSDEEWTTLTSYISNEVQNSTIDVALKSTSGWDNDGNGTDIYGFSGQPGGYRSVSDGNFNGAGLRGNWWSSTQYNSMYAYYRLLKSTYDYVGDGYTGKGYGFSVRCVKD